MLFFYFLFSGLNKSTTSGIFGYGFYFGFSRVFLCVCCIKECNNDVRIDVYYMVQPGTYFYHGHYGMQRAAGLYGSLIVDLPKGQNEPFHYDSEFNLLLSDLWHVSSHEQEVGLSSKPLKWIGEPQVISLKRKCHDFFFFCNKEKIKKNNLHDTLIFVLNNITYKQY